MKIGRNDPCPCGSGRKYKVCCRAHHEAAQREARAIPRAFDDATDRLDELVPGFLAGAAEAVFPGFLDLGFAAVENAVGEHFNIHVLDWALGDHTAELAGELVSASDLLDRGVLEGIPTAAAEWVRAFASAPLRLWRVRSVGPTIELEDALEKERTVELRDPELCRVLVEDDVIGLRVAEVAGTPESFWSPWFFDRRVVAAVRRHLATPRAGERERTRLARAIATAWYEELRELIRENAAGRWVESVTDTFEITDRNALVDWMRGEGLPLEEEDGARRCTFLIDDDDLLATISVAEDLEVVTPTLEDADVGREWIESRLGGWVRFARREVDEVSDEDEVSR